MTLGGQDALRYINFCHIAQFLNPLTNVVCQRSQFHLVGVDATGRAVIRKRCSRTQLLAFTANLQVQLICGVSAKLNEWPVHQANFARDF
jgi:hypothetical protein